MKTSFAWVETEAQFAQICKIAKMIAPERGDDEKILRITFYNFTGKIVDIINRGASHLISNGIHAKETRETVIRHLRNGYTVDVDITNR